MAVITRQELQGNGIWWTWINYEGYDTFIHESPTQISEEEAIILKDNYIDMHLYDTTYQTSVSVYDNIDVIKSAVTFIKIENPNLSQWNNYLASLVWDDALAVRWFLAILAKELSNRKDLDLTQWTETEVLSKLKAWIIATPARKLGKILFGIEQQ